MRLSFLSKNRTEAGRQSGFTLLEVLIAITLLAFISLAIYQTTTETFRLRDKLLHEGDFYNGIRMAMSIVDRDVSMMYSPIMMKAEQKGLQLPPTSPEMMALQNSETNDFWGAPIDKTGLRPSRFIGTDSKMSFISLSHIRVYKDSPESEVAKIRYELKPDETDKQNGTMVLVKTESPNAFDLDERKDKMVHYYPLLPGIKKLKYRYYWKEKDRWENSWDSSKEDYKNKFPDMVEITIEVQGPSRLSFEGIYKFRPEVPLNGIMPTT